MTESRSESYAAAGVDVTAGYEAVDRIKPLVRSTYIPGVIGDLGGFGGLFKPDLNGVAEPVLVSGTDGVGTKLKIAFLTGRHDTVGIDCVAMCVNDIVCSGAVPLFFLDYLAVGKNYPERIEQIVSGVTEGCRQAGCALIGGETAEMPGFYATEEYDLAGFSVGLLDKVKVIDGSGIAPGDTLVGLASSGVHSNGFSLVRKVLDVENRDLSAYIPALGKSLGEELLTPTKIYVKAVKSLIASGVAVKAISHITGGGLFENVPRMLPEGIVARIEKNAIPKKPIFDLIAKTGNIPERDMYNTFNMGVGMLIAVDSAEAEMALAVLNDAGETAFIAGSCVSGNKGVELW